MNRTIPVLETSRPDFSVWPSIAAASAEIRRPRRPDVVRARAERPAVLGRAARPRTGTSARRSE
jgi:hypothetical protein